jgi:hypothetical protein
MLTKAVLVLIVTSILSFPYSTCAGKNMPVQAHGRFSTDSGSGEATIYVTPQNNSFLTPPTVINDSFTIAIRIANYTHVAGWQTKLLYNKEHLYTTTGNVTLAQDFIFPPLTYPIIPPIIGSCNATHDYILMSTATYGVVEYSGSDACLIEIKLFIKSLPNPAKTLESLLWLEPVDTWTIDQTLEENTEHLVNGFYKIRDVPQHDIAITAIEISTTNLTKGDLLNVNVTVLNEGLYTETIQLSAYGNWTRIDTKTFILAPKNTTTITFIWNTTTAKTGKYIIGAYAPPVTNETHTEDNGLSDGWVTIRPSGDINQDGKVDGKDIAIVSRAYNTKPGDLLWDSRADLNNDLKVDGKDIAIVAKDYGT